MPAALCWQDWISISFPSLIFRPRTSTAVHDRTGLQQNRQLPSPQKGQALTNIEEIRKQYHTRNVSQQYLVICNRAYINLVSLWAFNLLIYNLWSRKELEIDTILPQFPAGPKDILAQKLHSFQLMLNENKQKVFFKTISLFRRGGYFCQHWNNIKTECLLLSTVQHALGVGEGQPANL